MNTPTITELIEDSLACQRTPDVSDQATRVEEEAAMHRQIAHARKMKREQEPDSEGVYPFTECRDCDSPIGSERIKVSIQNRTCIGCATAHEKRIGYRS